MDKRYPYARVKAMKEIFEFIREPGWKPDVFDTDLLKKLAIAPSKEYETISTLEFLNIIDSNGVPTSRFEELKKDFKVTLKQLIQEAYDELFNLLPVRLINQERLIIFFGTARDTAEYQGKLFVWLCEQAGLELPNVEKEFHRARYDK